MTDTKNEIEIIRNSGRHVPNGTYVWCSRYESQHDDGGWGLGSQSKSVWVQGFARGQQVFSRTVRGTFSADPHAKNAGGGRGTVHPAPPTAQQVQAVVDAALAAIAEA